MRSTELNNNNSTNGSEYNSVSDLPEEVAMVYEAAVNTLEEQIGSEFFARTDPTVQNVLSPLYEIDRLHVYDNSKSENMTLEGENIENFLRWLERDQEILTDVCYVSRPIESALFDLEYDGPSPDNEIVYLSVDAEEEHELAGHAFPEVWLNTIAIWYSNSRADFNRRKDEGFVVPQTEDVMSDVEVGPKTPENIIDGF